MWLKKSRIYNEQEDSFLTLLVNLGIYGAALPVMAEDKTDSAALTNEDTIVVTAAQQNLQAPGVSTITADEIRKIRPRATCQKSSAPCRA